MKLLFCETCGDIFKLQKIMRACLCGEVRGRYIDNLRAEVTSNAVSLAIGNGSLRNAMLASETLQTRAGAQYANREDYIDECQILAWVRPNTGAGNPHTTILEQGKYHAVIEEKVMHTKPRAGVPAC